MRDRLPALRQSVIHGREPRFERALPGGWLAFLDGAAAVSPDELAARERAVSPDDPFLMPFTIQVIDPATGAVVAPGLPGELWVNGRAQDVIHRDGQAIYPRDVEDLLHRHPAVAAAQVIGVPDPEHGEAVMAWIQLRPGHTATATDLAELATRSMPAEWAPASYRFVDSFPTNTAGKVQKFALREMAARPSGY